MVQSQCTLKPILDNIRKSDNNSVQEHLTRRECPVIISDKEIVHPVFSLVAYPQGF